MSLFDFHFLAVGEVPAFLHVNIQPDEPYPGIFVELNRSGKVKEAVVVLPDKLCPGDDDGKIGVVFAFI
jgi:hypothetical protein